ncbi:hypothetical protein EJB05_49142, partial [Eragrostis curvula]
MPSAASLIVRAARDVSRAARSAARAASRAARSAAAAAAASSRAARTGSPGAASFGPHRSGLGVGAFSEHWASPGSQTSDHGIDFCPDQVSPDQDELDFWRKRTLCLQVRWILGYTRMIWLQMKLCGPCMSAGARLSTKNVTLGNPTFAECRESKGNMSTCDAVV